MKTRWLSRGLMLGSLLWLGGCGGGTYEIPPVAPVVKEKPQDDLLQNIEGNTSNTSSGGSSSDSSSTGGSADDSDDKKK